MKINPVATAIILSFFFVLPVVSFAQPGSLDISFDADGKTTTPIGSADDYGRSLAIQADGKILMAGYSYTGSRDVSAIVRYNTNGSLDNTFDSDGIVTTPIGTSGNRAHAIALQSDGKIVVAGYSYNGTDNDFALTRYNTNGSLDITFDTDGIVTTGMGTTSNDRAFSLAIQNDGKIVAAGYYTNSNGQRDFGVARYNSNGSLDNTFNGTGIATLSIAIGGDEARSVTIQSDGKIVVAGFSFNFTTRVFAVVRYNTNGTLDNTFDTDGIVTTSIGNNDDAGYAVALQSDGKIVAAGYSRLATYDFALVRYNTNGSLDNTFDTDGIVTTSIGSSATSADEPFAVAIQSDGKILVAGHGDYDFALARYNTNGSLDNTFDTDGIVTTFFAPAGTDDIIYSVALQSDGKIVVAGNVDNSPNNDFAVARYNNNIITGINSATIQNSKIDISPNPFSVQTILKTDNPFKNATLNIYNCFGQQVKQLLNISGNSVVFFRSNLPSGVYFIRITDKSKSTGIFKLIITD